MSYERKDAHYRRAKAEGWRARSAYKLAELDSRFQLLRRGDHVVDLGAWPGGWMQVALARVGPTGRVVGVDRETIAPLGAPNAVVVTGDIRDPEIVAAVRTALGRRADIVLSDLAPKLTGVRATDEQRCEEVMDAALASLDRLLRPGGRFLAKVFMGGGFPRIQARLRHAFERVRTTRPEATRRGSAELYVQAEGFRPSRACG